MTEYPSRSTKMSADLTEFIREPMACPKCRYDLQGLFVGGNCPECGTLIARRRKVADDKMGDAPASYLRLLSGALLAFGLSGLMIPVGMMMSAMGSRYGLLMALGAMVVMPAAGLVILRRRERPYLEGKPEGAVSEWVWLRRTVAGGYGLQIFAFVLAGVAGIANWELSPWIGVILAVLIGAGICCSAWHISLLADWARDTARAAQLRACAMGLGLFLVAGVVSLVVSVPLRGVFGLTPTTEGMSRIIVILSVFLGFIGIGALFLIFIFTMLFSSTVNWAVTNAQTERERDQRLAERARERAEEMAKKSVGVARGSTVAEGLAEASGGIDFATPEVPPSFEPEEDDGRQYNPYGLED